MKRLALGDGFTLPAEAVTQTFAILAKRGAGKTYCALVLVEELLKAKAQVVIADPVGVCWGLRAAADGRKAGLPIIVLGGEHGDVPLEASAGKVIAEFVVETASSVVLDLCLFRKGDQARFMTDFAETLYHRNRAPLHLVLDEADAFAPQRPLHGQERLLGAIQDLVRRGRARGIGVTLVTQRAAVLSKDVLTQAEVLVALRTISPQDRAAIDAWIQAHDAHGQREEFMASLASLPIGTAWFWSPGWLEVFQRVQIRKRETFDSSATPKVGAVVRAPKQLAVVDLEVLKHQIAATIEKAKQEDPRELRRRIAELEQAVRKSEQRVDNSQRPVAKRVEVPILKDVQVKRLEKLFDRIVAEAERHGKAMSLFWGHQEEQAKVLVDALKSAHEGRRTTAFPPATVSSLSDRIRQQQRGGSGNAMSMMISRSMDRSGLPSGEERVLRAIAMYRDRATRELVTVLTGYKRATRDAYILRLRERKLVSVVGDRLVATDEGLASLGVGFEPLPTGAALREYWLDELPEGEGRVLMVLLEAYPKAVDRERVSEVTGYKRATRDAYLLRLRARQLVIADSRGEVCAAEELFV
jgi:hypothetical protein